jgi:hypothetical protein
MLVRFNGSDGETLRVNLDNVTHIKTYRVGTDRYNTTFYTNDNKTLPAIILTSASIKEIDKHKGVIEVR